MNTLISPIAIWWGRLNYRQLLLLNFVISSVGLIKLSIVFAGLIDHLAFAQLAYVQAGLSDWANGAGIGKHISLLQFVLSVVALFVQYGFFLVLSKTFAPALTRFFSKDRQLIILLMFLTAVIVNGVLLLTSSVAVLRLAILSVLWSVLYLWIPLYCIQKKLSALAMSNLSGRILLAVMVVQYAAVFVPLITGPMLIENDYLNIPERTILKSGQVVDNQTYINDHKIAGFHLYDPRKDEGHNPPARTGMVVQIENCPLVYSYLLAADKENKYKYSCDDVTHALNVIPPMTLDEKSILDKLQLLD